MLLLKMEIYDGFRVKCEVPYIQFEGKISIDLVISHVILKNRYDLKKYYTLQYFLKIIVYKLTKQSI